MSYLSADTDMYAVRQKLLRLGLKVEQSKIPIKSIYVCRLETDVLEVILTDTCLEPKATWMKFNCAISSAFSLAVKL